MKKPIKVIWNDVHLKTGNEDQILRAVRFMISWCIKNNVSRTIFAGDLFDSRTFQRLKVLKTFDTILDELQSANITVDIIPGNHDKTVYASYDSFLEQYRYHPGVNYYKGITELEVDGVKFTYLPFFSDDMLIPMLNEAKGGDVLISHFEMQGSTHLGNVSEKTTINKKMLSKWKKVYLGHYHNWHEITKDIVHLPSFIQANFGEDNYKGFTVLYDDLSYEIIKGDFKEYKKIKVDVDKTNTSQLLKLINTYKQSEDIVRFEFEGQESNLKAIDKKLFIDTGIDIKMKYQQKFTYEEDENKPDIITKFTKNKVQDLFKDFCKEKELDYKKGKELLDKFLNE